MDYLHVIFNLQLSSEMECGAIDLLDLRLRCQTNPQNFERVIKSLKTEQSDYQDAFNSDWFTSLAEAMRPFYVKKEGEEFYAHAFREFMKASLRTLNGDRSLFFGPLLFSAEHFNADALAQPHFRWVPLFIQRYTMLSEAFPERVKPVKMAAIHPLLKIDDARLNELYTLYKTDWDTVMDFHGFAEWYRTSRDFFAAENETIHPALEARLRKTMLSWFDSSMELNFDDLNYNLCRNYDIHPFHGPFILEWIKKLHHETQAN